MNHTFSALRDVVFSRLIQELAQIYDTISLSHLVRTRSTSQRHSMGDGQAFTREVSHDRLSSWRYQRHCRSRRSNHLLRVRSYRLGSSYRLSPSAFTRLSNISTRKPAHARAEAFRKSHFSSGTEEKAAASHRRLIVTQAARIDGRGQNIRREREEQTAQLDPSAKRPDGRGDSAEKSER